MWWRLRQALRLEMASEYFGWGFCHQLYLLYFTRPGHPGLHNFDFCYFMCIARAWRQRPQVNFHLHTTMKNCLSPEFESPQVYMHQSSEAKKYVSLAQLLHYTWGPQIIWCGFWGPEVQFESESVHTNMLFHKACAVAKKNHHRSLALSARHPVFLTVLPQVTLALCLPLQDHATDIHIMSSLSYCSLWLLLPSYSNLFVPIQNCSPVVGFGAEELPSISFKLNELNHSAATLINVGEMGLKNSSTESHCYKLFSSI